MNITLAIHAISTRWNGLLACHEARVLRLVRFLNTLGYRPSPAHDMLEPQRRMFHVTFDDGYRNTRSTIEKLLAMRVPVTLFVVTNYIEHGVVNEPYAVSNAVAADAEGELRAYTWYDVRELSHQGVEIGSHTVSHQHLTSGTIGDISRELAVSKELIEDMTGRPCRYVAYPYGDQNDLVREAAKSVGYDAAFGAPGDLTNRDRFDLPRLVVNRRDGVFRLGARVLVQAATSHRRSASPLDRGSGASERLGDRTTNARS